MNIFLDLIFNRMKPLQAVFVRTTITIFAILLSACAINSRVTWPHLEGTWVLTAYDDASPIDGKQPTIQFDNGQVSGTTVCNHYGGSYQITEDAISFTDIFSTEMACMEPEGVMEQERIYMELLVSADRYALADDVLILFAGSHQVMTFEMEKDAIVGSTPAVEDPTMIPTEIVALPTLTSTVEPPDVEPPVGFKEYRDTVIGVSVFIPESWVVTGIIEGDYAIFQSYPEEKYFGGEGRDPEDSKCDLNIQPAGISVGELIQQWESNEITTIVSEEEVVLQSGLIGQWFFIESMGRSVAFVAEINKRAIVLSCFGNPEPFEEIANTLNEFEVTTSSIHDSNEVVQQYRDSKTGVTLDVPGSWAITEVIPGVKATLQSLETTCELFIRSDISSANVLVTQMKSNEDTTIISDDQIVLNSGQPATRIEMNIEMDNIGQSMLVITEISEKVIVLSCVGDFTPVDEVAFTLRISE
jgi:heat shock protein HslJ